MGSLLIDCFTAVSISDMLTVFFQSVSSSASFAFLRSCMIPAGAFAEIKFVYFFFTSSDIVLEILVKMAYTEAV